MKILPSVAAFALLLPNLAAASTPHSPEEEVRAAADAFFAALKSEDKTALAGTMVPEGMIFIHDRRDPENPRVTTRSVRDHVKAWETSPQGTNEIMIYESVLVDGEMAHLWGPYMFFLNGKPTHCGTNSMSMVRTSEGWLVGNTSFTMTAMSECSPRVLPPPRAVIPSPEQ